MPIPPLNNIVDLDFSDPSCFNGSGTTVNDLSASNNDFALADTNYVFTTTYGGEIFIDTINLATTLNRSGLTGYSYGTAAFSFHMWVQINAKNGLDLTQIWSLNYTGGAGSHNNPFCGIVTGNNFFFTDGTDTLSTTTALSLDTWYLVTISKPAGGSSNDVDIYINGVGVPFTGGSASVINVDNTTPVNSLSAYAAGQPVWNSAQTIGEYKFYNVALSASDVTDFYNATKARYLVPAPTAKYSISDPSSYPGTGSTLFDISGNSFNITLSNVTYNDAYGNVPSLQFDGTSTSFGYYNGEIANIVSAAPVFSISIWVKAPIVDPPSYEAIFGYGKDGAPSIGGIPSLWPDRNVNNITFDFGSSNPQIASGFAAPPNAWEFYTITNDGTTVTLYINGGAYGTASSVGKQINTPARFCIGGFDTDLTNVSYPCDFELNYLSIHDVCLTAGEVSNLYNSTKSTYSTLCEFDFGNGSYPGTGSTLIDLSGCGNILTNTGGLSYTTAVGGEITLTSTQTFQITSTYPNNLPVGPQANTMVLWGRYNDNYNTAIFAQGGSNPNGARINMGYGEGSRLGVEVNGVGSRTSLADTPAIGDWFQFIVVKPTNDPLETNADFIFYYNGNLTGTEVFNGTAAIDINNNGVPGSGPGLAMNWNYYPIANNITIIKAAIYDGAWTASDVTQDFVNFTSRISTPTPYAGNVGGRSFGQGFNG